MALHADQFDHSETIQSTGGLLSPVLDRTAEGFELIPFALPPSASAKTFFAFDKFKQIKIIYL